MKKTIFKNKINMTFDKIENQVLKKFSNELIILN